MRVCALICVFASLVCGAQGQATAVMEACARYFTVPLPQDIEKHEVPKDWPKCDSYHFYSSGKFSEARACAIEERAALFGMMERSPVRPKPENARVYEPELDGAMVVLAELYANGEGVARNTKLAGRFLCEADEANQVNGNDEVTGLKKAFEQLEVMKNGEGKLVLCVNGDPPEGMPRTTYCDWQWLEIRAREMAGPYEEAEDDADSAKAQLEALVKRMTPRQKAAYAKVLAALDGFLNKLITGTALYPPPRSRAVGGKDEISENEERAALYATLAELIQKHPAAPKAGEFEAADGELNRIYKALMQFSGHGITTGGMRDEERAWLVERDAIVRFGATFDPKLPASAWELKLTQARTKDLQSIYAMFFK